MSRLHKRDAIIIDAISQSAVAKVRMCGKRAADVTPHLAWTPGRREVTGRPQRYARYVHTLRTATHRYAHDSTWGPVVHCRPAAVQRPSTHSATAASPCPTPRVGDNRWQAQVCMQALTGRCCQSSPAVCPRLIHLGDPDSDYNTPESVPVFQMRPCS